MKKSIFIILLVLIIDQASKIWIKTNFNYGDSLEIFSWFKLTFVENEGMAYGIRLGDGVLGKYILSIFRVFAISGIGYWLFSNIKKGASSLFTITLSLIFAGAIGNLLDSTFYGLMFDKGKVFNTETGFWNAYEGIASIDYQGYSSLMQGVVVDMLYFPMWEGYLPEWIPFKGGQYYVFFQPVFNVADAAISLGVCLMLIFYNRIFKEE